MDYCIICNCTAYDTVISLVLYAQGLALRGIKGVCMSIELITPEQFATIASMNVRTVVRLIKEGQIPGVKVGGRYRLLRSEVENWLKTRARIVQHRILSVDDNKEVLIVLKKQIEEMGHEFVGVTDGEQAIEVLKKNTDFSLLILDLLMPGKTGVDVMAWMEQNEVQMPVLIYTGHIDHKLCLQAMKYQFFTVLSKPCTKAELQRCVGSILCGVSAMGESA